MALTSGNSIGPYTIVASIGAGGMGEVYRARDNRLGREAAIKILPATVAENQDRLKRFEREARTASSLNHPNIVTIYDIGSVDSQTYIAMELIDGKTLRSAGTLSLPKILNIACQIADGLAKAHAAGIVHRDLKPENIMITKDGFVKILDFGLAKLTNAGSDPSSQMLTQSETETKAGTILGTVGYMSPEQAAGEALDFRSDQFSFGTILYELISGKHPFRRKTSAETLTAILNEQPPSLTQAPAPLSWIVERCTAKDPKDRYESTRDLAKDLQNVRDYITKGEKSGSVAPSHQKGRSRHFSKFLAAAITILLLIAAGFLYKKFSTVPLLTYSRVTFRRGYVSSARFAPDGQTIIYSASYQGEPDQLYLTRTQGVDSRELGIQNAEVLSISATGEIALLKRETNNLWREGVLEQLSLSGGAPREIADHVLAACWSRDGSMLALARRIGNVTRVEFPRGKILYETSQLIRGMHISPDDKLIAFQEHFSEAAAGSISMINLRGEKVATSGQIFPESSIWHDANELWIADWDSPTGVGTQIRSLNTSGKQSLIQRFPHAKLHDISRDKQLLLSFEDGRIEAVLMNQEQDQNVSWLDGTEVVDISRDGKTLLLMESEEASVIGGIYLRRLDGSPAVRLGAGWGRNLSKDGRYALVAQPLESRIVLLPTGAGETKTFDIAAYRAENIFPEPNLSPDFSYILFNGRQKGHQPRAYIQKISGGTPVPATEEAFTVVPDTISPDGRVFLAMDSNHKVFIYSVSSHKKIPVVGIDADEKPFAWNTDGSAIYVYTRDIIPAEVFRLDPSTGSRSSLRKWKPVDATGLGRLVNVVMTPDEKTFVFSYERNLSTLYLLTGLK